MNTIIRLFANSEFNDVPLYTFRQYSVGSNTANGYNISNSDLLPEHIKFTNNGAMYSFECIGPVYFKKEITSKGYLSVGQMFILSKKHRISMLVLEESTVPVKTIDFPDGAELSFGKGTDNDVIFSNTYISRRHFTISKRQNRLFLSDNESTNGTFVNGKKVSRCEPAENDEIVVGAFKIKVSGDKLCIYGNAKEISVRTSHRISATAPRPINTSENDGGRTLFKRSPRLKRDVPTGTIEIQSPPALGQKPETNWLSILLPALGTISVSVVMALFMGRNLSMLAFSIPMTLIGLIVSVTNYYKQSNSHKKKEQLRIDKYTEHLNDVIKQIETKSAEQRKALILAAPETNECFNIVRERQSRLWDRRPSDSDFADIRVGSGSVPFSMDIRFQRSGLSLEEDALKNKPQEIYDRYKEISNIPITCPILNTSTCGIIGSRSDALKLINNMLVQVATHHCYTEVKTVIVYDEREDDELSWTANLPHCYDDERKGCLIAKNKEEASELFSNLEKLLKERLLESEDESYGITTLKLPFFLFVISAPAFLERETIQRFLFKNDISLGVGTICLFDKMELLPQQCNMIIEVKNSEGRIYHKERASEKQKFSIDRTSSQDFYRYGENIKNIYCEEMPGETAITKKITLFEVLGINSASELDLDKRWANANVTKTLAAPLGVKEKNETVYLDLHEEAHGPHGLVAGTTGSGKSEVLQSYILSVATLYHPYEISFFLIDFKGGGMANQFVKLPHLIGAITDLENNENAEKETKRSLLSIRAELNRRKRLFEKSGVNKIDQYIELYKNGRVDTPLPHLVIIVDEFAELKAQQPDFMNELVSAARIGRSLGVHLILATQKPSGQVSEQIWTNSKFKLCLKVAEASDSNEVIKSPVAAKITNPGRAYLRVENSLDLFQSGYSGAKVFNDKDDNYTELNALVDYINAHCEERGIKKLPPICLPMLDDVIPYDSEKIKERVIGSKIPFGIYDNPAAQIQDYAYIDINQNTFVVGSARTGKTNLLQSIIRTLSSTYSPDELNMYIMDFGSFTLKIFESLNHVGGVVLPDEDEKLKNLLKLLSAEIELRKKKTLSVGVSSYSAYLEGGYSDMPRIVLILDNFYSFKEMYEDAHENEFIDICKNGLAYGISVIVTNSQTGGFNHRHLKSFADRIAFYCNDPGEYYNVFETHRVSVDNIPGRVVYKTGNGIAEAQTFLAFEGEKEIDRTTVAKSHINTVNALYPLALAKKIPCIPEVLTMNYILENYPGASDNHSCILGLNYENVDVVSLDFSLTSELPVIGKESSKNKKASLSILKSYTADKTAFDTTLYIIDSVDRPFREYSDKSYTSTYTIDYTEIENIIDEMYDSAVSRQEMLKSESTCDSHQQPSILAVINNRDAVDYISSDKELLGKYKELIKLSAGFEIAFLYADVDDVSVGFQAPELMKRFKDNKKAIITDNVKTLKFFDFIGSETRKIKELQNDDVVYHDGNNLHRIKMVKGD